MVCTPPGAHSCIDSSSTRGDSSKQRCCRTKAAGRTASTKARCISATTHERPPSKTSSSRRRKLQPRRTSTALTAGATSVRRVTQRIESSHPREIASPPQLRPSPRPPRGNACLGALVSDDYAALPAWRTERAAIRGALDHQVNSSQHAGATPPSRLRHYCERRSPTRPVAHESPLKLSPFDRAIRAPAGRRPY